MQQLLFNEPAIRRENPIRYVAEYELTYKRSATLQQNAITSSMAAADLFRKMFPSTEIQEYFYVMYLNRANKPVGYYQLSKGGMTGTMADKRLIFAAALKIPGCTSLMMAHNHPSGSIRPSRADEQLTQQIKEAGEIMDIKLLDHIILGGENEYYSFTDEGLL